MQGSPHTLGLHVGASRPCPSVQEGSCAAGRKKKGLDWFFSFPRQSHGEVKQSHKSCLMHSDRHRSFTHSFVQQCLLSWAYPCFKLRQCPASTACSPPALLTPNRRAQPDRASRVKLSSCEILHLGVEESVQVGDCIHKPGLLGVLLPQTPVGAPRTPWLRVTPWR